MDYTTLLTQPHPFTDLESFLVVSLYEAFQDLTDPGVVKANVIPWHSLGIA